LKQALLRTRLKDLTLFTDNTGELAELRDEIVYNALHQEGDKKNASYYADLSTL
jgi:hypothetical protein